MRTIAEPAADDILDLAVFAKVVDTRSFTAAAKAMGMSKSSLSARITRLEARAGVRLLHRTTRKVSLTDAGAALYPSCARLTTGADEAARALVRLGDDVEREVRGLVRISADSMMSETIIPAAAAAACERWRDLRVELSSDDAFVDVIHGGFDVVIRTARKLDARIVGRQLARSERVVVAAPSYLAKFGTPSTIDDLVQHRCLRYRFRQQQTISTEFRFLTARGMRSIDVDGPFVANFDGPLIAAAVAGLGITVMASSVVHAHLTSGALVRLLPEAKLEPVGIWALHPWRRSPPPRVRAVIDAIAAEMKRSPAFARA